MGVHKVDRVRRRSRRSGGDLGNGILTGQGVGGARQGGKSKSLSIEPEKPENGSSFLKKTWDERGSRECQM